MLHLLTHRVSPFVCVQFMDGILADLPNLPPSFRFVCARLMKASNAKFHDASSIPHRSGYINNAAAAAVGGFLFLRLITPALMSPSAHGLITTSPWYVFLLFPRVYHLTLWCWHVGYAVAPDRCLHGGSSFARRSLLLVAKLLQATISGADVGRKDPFFAPTCTAFVNTNRPRLLHAFAQLGTVARGVDPTVACGSDAEVFCAGGAVIEQDLAAILDVATLPANAAALIEHLPPSSSPGMRAAFRHLMTAECVVTSHAHVCLHVATLLGRRACPWMAGCIMSVHHAHFGLFGSSTVRPVLPPKSHEAQAHAGEHEVETKAEAEAEIESTVVPADVPLQRLVTWLVAVFVTPPAPVDPRRAPCGGVVATAK